MITTVSFWFRCTKTYWYKCHSLGWCRKGKR